MESLKLIQEKTSVKDNEIETLKNLIKQTNVRLDNLAKENQLIREKNKALKVATTELIAEIMAKSVEFSKNQISVLETIKEKKN